VETATDEIIAEALPDSSEASRGFMLDIVEACRGVEHAYARSAAFGSGWHTNGGDLGGLTREILRLTRVLEDRVEDRQALRAAIDDAAARALETFETAKRGRRDRWLSYFAHEMRNALNTLVNAQWILKNGDSKKADRVFDMSERAIRRLEASIKEFRELEEHTLKPAPNRPDP
jgi:hypothetical protein